MSAVLVLVPPSEGKAPGGRGRWQTGAGSFDHLGPQRRDVIDALVRVPPASWSKMSGASGELADRAAEAARALQQGTARSMPSWQRFTGVVWEHLDPASLPDPARRRVIVPSALLGLTRGTDPAPDFRLKFSVSLPGIGRLDRWWRSSLTEALRRTRGPILDLLPKEHAAALDLDALGRRVQRVSFVDRGGAAVGHDAKAVKGHVARVVLRDGIEALDELCWSGWEARRESATSVAVVRG
jgi:cytoplasmic iron level regulating protein YaaA (DUF328/UPF0246 family)